MKQSDLQEKQLCAYQSPKTKVTAIKDQNKSNEQLNVAGTTKGIDDMLVVEACGQLTNDDNPTSSVRKTS